MAEYSHLSMVLTSCRRLADWSSDEERDPSALPQTDPRFDKVVILRQMFRPVELEEDPDAAMEIRQDIQQECEKHGIVTNITLFDLEPQGIISVRFQDSRAARACVEVMQGRSFDKRIVEASIADGSERFRRTDPKKSAKEDGKDDNERLKEYADYLEEDEEDE